MLKVLSDKLSEAIKETNKVSITSKLFQAYVKIFMQRHCQKEEPVAEDAMDCDDPSDKTAVKDHVCLLLRALVHTIAINKSKEVDPSWLCADDIMSALMDWSEEDFVSAKDKHGLDLQALWKSLLK